MNVEDDRLFDREDGSSGQLSLAKVTSESIKYIYRFRDNGLVKAMNHERSIMSQQEEKKNLAD